MEPRQFCRGRLSCLLVALLASGADAAPAAPGSDVEIFAGYSILSLLTSHTYDGSYTPSRVGGISDLFQTPDPRSRGRQSLTLDGGMGGGLGIGVAFYPHRVLGIQLLVDRADTDLKGASPAHTVDLVWDSIAFPSSERVVREASYSFDTPDTDARFRMLSLSLNAAARFRNGSRLSGTVSAGASYFRFHATDLRVGAFAGFLGGHAVLFSDLYETSAETAPADVLGLNVGGDLSLVLGSGFSVFADGRFYYAPSRSAPLELKTFAVAPIIEVPLEQIGRSLELRPLSLDPRHLRLLVGLKWRP